eukprot:Hpha_TRINITY_DN15644_c0_g1::TRINITY_DN15644_c0_g1_i1::g.97548::m.97548
MLEGAGTAPRHELEVVGLSARLDVQRRPRVVAGTTGGGVGKVPVVLHREELQDGVLRCCRVRQVVPDTRRVRTEYVARACVSLGGEDLPNTAERRHSILARGNGMLKTHHKRVRVPRRHESGVRCTHKHLRLNTCRVSQPEHCSLEQRGIPQTSRIGGTVPPKGRCPGKHTHVEVSHCAYVESLHPNALQYRAQLQAHLLTCHKRSWEHRHGVIVVLDQRQRHRRTFGLCLGWERHTLSERRARSGKGESPTFAGSLERGGRSLRGGEGRQSTGDRGREAGQRKRIGIRRNGLRLRHRACCRRLPTSPAPESGNNS